jgi:uncharacterized protein (TIGR00369 family)
MAARPDPSGRAVAASSCHDAGVGAHLAETVIERYRQGGSGLMHEMDLRIVEAEPGRVRFVLPVTPRLVHGGGVLCGQAILACMDTGIVFVMMTIDGRSDDDFTTVQLQTSFERGVPGDVGEAVFEARATRIGRTLVFGEIDLLLPDGRRAAHATTTCMWL